MSARDPWALTSAQRRELLASLSDDYVLGYELGVSTAWSAYAAGWEAAEADMASGWAKIAAEVQAGARQPSAAALAERRQQDHQPCPTKCDACSQCLHSRAWYARGQREYTGGPVEWGKAPSEPRRRLAVVR